MTELTPIDSETAATKTVALVLETDLDAGIETVWRALSDPDVVARWLSPDALDIEPGHMVDFGGDIRCRVIESEPPRRLSYLWPLPAGEGAEVVDTVVRFELDALPDGRTHLKLVHDGFVVPADRSVDRIVEAEDVVVLLPLSAIARRRIRPRVRRPAVFHRGALPLVMRLAA